MADLKYVNFHSLYLLFYFFLGVVGGRGINLNSYINASITLNQFSLIRIYEHFINGQCWILFAITRREVRNNHELYGITYFVLCRDIGMVIFVVWELKVAFSLSC